MYTEFGKQLMRIVINLGDLPNPRLGRGVYGNISEAAKIRRETLSRWMRCPKGSSFPARIPSSEQVKTIVEGLVRLVSDGSTSNKEELAAFRLEWSEQLERAAVKDRLRRQCQTPEGTWKAYWTAIEAALSPDAVDEAVTILRSITDPKEALRQLIVLLGTQEKR